MSEQDALYKVPGLMNPRLRVWAIDCEGCGKQQRLGPGSRAGIIRMLGVTGRTCGPCLANTTTTDQRATGREREQG